MKKIISYALLGLIINIFIFTTEVEAKKRYYCHDAMFRCVAIYPVCIIGCFIGWSLCE